MWIYVDYIHCYYQLTKKNRHTHTYIIICTIKKIGKIKTEIFFKKKRLPTYNKDFEILNNLYNNICFYCYYFFLREIRYYIALNQNIRFISYIILLSITRVCVVYLCIIMICVHILYRCFRPAKGPNVVIIFFFFANSLLVFTHDDTNLFNILHTLSIITLC